MSTNNNPSTSRENNVDTPQDVNEIDHEAIQRRQSVLRSGSLDITHLLKSCGSDAEINLLRKEAAFYKFVLTGGPCGGKTTALARLSSYLRERGFEVCTVPEAFTIMVNNGFSMSYFSVSGMPFCVQNSVMDLQMSLEDSLERILRARGKPAVLLCDRGLMDGSAYMTPPEWDNLLQSRNVTSAEIREGRYNAVFHLVTAAEGAEMYYTLENNSARTESAEEARQVDQKTQAAWVGHNQFFVFDNSTDFEGKLSRLVNVTSTLVGLPSTSKSVTLKYLLKCPPDLSKVPFYVKYSIFEVDKVYLYDIDIDKSSKYAEEYSFIRKRSHVSESNKNLGTSYALTTTRITHDGKQIEVKRIISAREYNSAYKSRDMTRRIVKQKRISFLWKMQSFTIHIYRDPSPDLCLMHVQVSDLGDQGIDLKNDESDGATIPKCEIPDFIQVERHLNDKKDISRFGSFTLSKIR